MGWIRTGNPAKQLHSLAANVEVERVKSDSPSPTSPKHNVAIAKQDNTSPTSPKHDVATAKQDNSYPIQSKKTEDKDLPFIPASEVKARDGKDGNRLCESYALTIFIPSVYPSLLTRHAVIVVDTKVIDCTTYISKHPAGRSIIQGFGGQDCSWQWWTFHNREIWSQIAMGLRVGRTEDVENKFGPVKPKAFVGLRGLGYQDDWA